MLSSTRSDNIHRPGVAIALNKDLANHMQGYNLVNQRIMMIQLNTGSLFPKYMHQTHHNEEDKDDFYTVLQQELTKLPKKCKLIYAYG